MTGEESAGGGASPVESLPVAIRAKFDSLPPFIQDTVLRGARLRALLTAQVLMQLQGAAASRQWEPAAAVLTSISPKHPPESMLEGLLFFFALNDESENAETIKTLLDLLAAHRQDERQVERDGADRPRENNPEGQDPG